MNHAQSHFKAKKSYGFEGNYEIENMKRLITLNEYVNLMQTRTTDKELDKVRICLHLGEM